MLNEIKTIAPTVGACLVGFTASEWVAKDKGMVTRLLAAAGFGIASLLIAKKAGLV